MGRVIPRVLPLLVAALTAALVAAAAPPPPVAAAAEQVEVRAHDHKEFGRLAFEWRQPIRVEGEPGPDALTLRFARPFSGDLATVAGRLGPYVHEAARGASAAEVVLRLRPNVRHKLFTLDDRIVVVDLFRDDRDLPVLPVRTGRHAGYTRLAFDLPFAADYRVEREGERVTVRFDRPARIDAAAIPRSLAPLVAAAEADTDAQASHLTLRVPPEAGLRHFRLPDNRVVVDVIESGDRAATSTAQSEAPGVEPLQTAAPSPSGPTSTGPEPSPPPSLEMPPLTLAVDSRSADGGVELRFAWSLPVAAAVFVRAGHLWTVFAAGPANADGALPPTLDAAAAEILEPGEVVPAEGGMALRFALRRQVEAGAARDGGLWRVVLQDKAPPPRSLEPRRLADPPRLFFPGAGTVVRLIDPAVGDRLGVLPLLESNRGQPRTRRLVELELLATAQGVAWRPLADGLHARPVEGGVELGTPEGLRLTALPEERGTERAETDGPSGVGAGEAAIAADRVAERAGPAAGAGEESTDPDPPLGLAAVVFDPAESALSHRQKLLQRVLHASPERRDSARLDLARFLLSRALAAETLAVLGAVGAAAPTADNPDGAANTAAPMALTRDGLAGAAQLLMGRLREAEARLSAEALDDDPEVALWRAVLAAAEGDWPRAARELERSGRTLASYPLPLRVRLGLTTALIALEAGQPPEAYAVLDGLKGLDLTPYDRAQLRFTEALALARDGALTAAEQTWRELATTGPAETRQKALYALTALLLEADRIGPDEAVAKLEAARPFWRGHPWETTMLDGLARVYAQRRNHQRALATWQEAIGRRSDGAEAAAITEAMDALFVAALTAEGDEAPSPLEAFALYRDFPDLMPNGAAGERLMRRLAERLADMDLIEEAAELLERQIHHGLKDAARAEAGAYLAELWLREPAPEAALKALRASTTTAELPEDLRNRRRMVEARALVAQGRTDDALGVIERDASRAARLMRMAIHFDRRDWPQVIEAASGLLPERADPETSLGREERELVLELALAHAQTGDWSGLRALHARFGEAMVGQPEHAAFAMATAGDPHAGTPEAVLAGAAEQVDAVRTLLEGRTREQ